MTGKLTAKAWIGAGAGFVLMTLLWHYDVGLTRHGRPIGGNPWGESLLLGAFVAALVIVPVLLGVHRRGRGDS